MLKILFDNNLNKKQPKVSFILIDWSCRESYHTIDYLNDQSVPRDDYEIIWIEYYKKKATGIKQKLNDYQAQNRLPALDKWIIMGMPANVHYHKHLMYNLGIALASGEIITMLDPDSVVSKNFVQAILDSFKQKNNIVLHMDEARNNSRRFYPFNYPSIDEIKGEGCVNWVNGKTRGLWDESDILHSRNYGACMAAARKDILAIGAADEHIDYLGRMCGPYEMTFRLRNHGLKEIWSDTEFLYHVWHPGVTEGKFSDYIGPSDGKNMSLTALEAVHKKRVFPLLENKVIAELRSGSSGEIDLSKLIAGDRLKRWRKDKIKERTMSVTNHVLIEEGYKGYNIISFEGRFYALPQGVGFDVNKLEQDEYFCANTVTELRKLLTPTAALGKILMERIVSLEKAMDERSIRIVSLEKAMDERTVRIVSLEKLYKDITDHLVLLEEAMKKL
jgi:hypothetical protein